MADETRVAVVQWRCRRCGRVFDGATWDEADAHHFLRTTSAFGSALHKPCYDQTSNTHGVGIGDLVGFKWEPEKAKEEKGDG